MSSRDRYPLTVWIEHLLIQRDDARRALGAALRRVEEAREVVEETERAIVRSWEESRTATGGGIDHAGLVDDGRRNGEPGRVTARTAPAASAFRLLQAHRHREVLGHRLADERAALVRSEERAESARNHLASLEDELGVHERRRDRWHEERRREALRKEERDAQEIAGARHGREQQERTRRTRRTVPESTREAPDARRSW